LSRADPGDYRIFIGAFPTGELADRIQAVRRAYDEKTAVITPPHVTLAGTYWRHGPAEPASEAELIARLQATADTLPAFELILGGIRTFGGRVVYLGVAETPELLATRQTLLTAAGPDKHGRSFTPHLTLAMRLKPAQVQAMLQELRAGAWENGRFAAPITQLHLMQRGPQDPAWRAIAVVPLISRSSSAAGK